MAGATAGVVDYRAVAGVAAMGRRRGKVRRVGGAVDAESSAVGPVVVRRYLSPFQESGTAGRLVEESTDAQISDISQGADRVIGYEHLMMLACSRRRR